MAESSPLLTVSLPNVARRADDAPAISARTLVEAHADFVWRSLRRLGVPESGADDATQQVFVIAAGKLDRIQVGRERAFLFGIVGHVAMHARRSLARKRELPYEDGAHDRVDPALRPDEAMAARQARALLDEVLDGMDDDLRTVFILFELEELTTSDVAVMLGVPLGTVASRLRRAREDFQRAVKRVRAKAAPSRGEP
jgi:RNA polymerase sigma-70 factor (ECF subfamily)